MKRRIFRWKGLGALAVFSLLGTVWWLIFGEPTVESMIEDAGTQSLGTQVDIGSLEINLTRASLQLGGIAIADPFDPDFNIIDAASARLELELEPLLQKKIVVRSFSVDGVRSGTRRATPARPVDTTGFIPRALSGIRRFRDAIDVPLLSLTPIDTIRAIAVDPTQLRTVQSALALERNADSLKTTFIARADALLSGGALDSARAVASRLRGQSVTSLGVAGTLRAISDVRRTIARLDSLRRAVDELQRDVRRGLDTVAASLRALDDSRMADYQFARGLVRLPSFDAPRIGPSLFGDVSIGTFEKGLYWIQLAREHAPPGLRPRRRQGPGRIRRAGTTVQFVKDRSYPRFLLRDGTVSLSLGEAAGAARGEYALTTSNITTEPALAGAPMRFTLRRSSAASDVRLISARGTLDHTGLVPHDSVDVNATEVKLPAFDLPGIPIRADLGRGESRLSIELRGDSVRASLAIEAAAPAWILDSTRAAALNTLERLVAGVIGGITTLNLQARLDGTLAEPRLSLRSNLDSEIAASIRSVAGDEIRRVEQRLRAQVDSLINERVAPIRSRVAQGQAEVETRLREALEGVAALRGELVAILQRIGGESGVGSRQSAVNASPPHSPTAARGPRTGEVPVPPA